VSRRCRRGRRRALRHRSRSPVAGPEGGGHPLDQRRARAVVALDVPSGMNADTGSSMDGEAVRADATVTFAHLKLGHVTGSGREALRRGARRRHRRAGVAPHRALRGARRGKRRQAARSVPRAVDVTQVSRRPRRGPRGLVRQGRRRAPRCARRPARRGRRGHHRHVGRCAIASLEPRVVEMMTCAARSKSTREQLDALLANKRAVVDRPGLRHRRSRAHRGRSRARRSFSGADRLRRRRARPCTRDRSKASPPPAGAPSSRLMPASSRASSVRPARRSRTIASGAARSAAARRTPSSC
jgi:hypothetical protein